MQKFGTLAALGAGLLCAGIAAHAQIGIQFEQFAADVKTASSKQTSVHLMYAPIAVWNFEGAGASTSRNTNFLFSADATFGKHFGLGGWYNNFSNTFLYEIHGRYYFNNQLGVQLGTVGGEAFRVASNGTTINKENTNDIDGFLFYRTRPARWNGELGLGFYGTDGGNTGPTFYLAGSYSISRAWSIDLSFWYINSDVPALRKFSNGTFANTSANQTQTRFTAGIGYSF